MLSDFHWHAKESVHFFRLSVWPLRVVSTRSVWSISFLTDFAVPIVDSICFSITNGDSEVIGFSELFDLRIRYFAKLSCDVKIAEATCSSSSESSLSRL